MHKSLLVISIFSGTVFAQNPLESRVYYLDGNEIRRYEANLKLDSDMVDLFKKSVIVSTCTKVSDPAFKLNTPALIDTEIKAFDNTVKNIKCDFKGELTRT